MDAYGIVFAIIIVIWLSSTTWYLWRTNSLFRQLKRHGTGASLQEILHTLLGQVTVQKKKTEALQTVVDTVIQNSGYNLTHVGVTRFNPFADTGGEQSFILTLLDGHGSGVVLTSLHNRGTTRWYAKNVVNGKGIDIDLSDEEKKAIRASQKKKKAALGENYEQ